jgi:hypothetical protein
MPSSEPAEGHVQLGAVEHRDSCRCATDGCQCCIQCRLYIVRGGINAIAVVVQVVPLCASDSVKWPLSVGFGNGDSLRFAARAAAGRDEPRSDCGVLQWNCRWLRSVRLRNQRVCLCRYEEPRSDGCGCGIKGHTHVAGADAADAVQWQSEFGRPGQQCRC